MINIRNLYKTLAKNRVRFLLLALLFASVLLFYQKNKQPALVSKKEAVKAINITKTLSAIEQLAYTPGDDFEIMPAPGENDWLAKHEERGQTFKEYCSSSYNKPGESGRSVIYIIPIYDFSASFPSLPEELKEYSNAFFCMETRILDSLDINNEKTIRRRINPNSKNPQVNADDILEHLKKIVPKDAYCLIAVTMEDLYPEDSWNFVFGLASYTERTGVFSFARFRPGFYGEQIEPGKNYEQIFKKRCCKVLVHETGHMFGLEHCIYYKCVMNGANHLGEADASPMFLCPVCLRKLQHCMGFDIMKRYENLLAFYEKSGFSKEYLWLKMRMDKIQSGKVNEK